MSDAPAAPAPITENGVPPATQEKVIDEVPGHKVFAGNLAYTTTDDALKAFFEPVQSDIVSCQVILRGTRSAGYGFVALTTEAAATKAVELLNKKELDGRPIIVEVAKLPEQKEKKPKATKKRTNRRGDKAVPGEVTEAEANGDVVADKAADTTDAVPTTDEAAKPKKKKKSARKNKKKTVEGEEGAVAATDGTAPPAADGAAPADGTPAGEKKPKAKKAKTPRPRRPVGEDPSGEPSKTMLFVANLGFNLDDAGLEALFKEAGVNVTSARVVRRRWGNPRRSKGYGFVDVGGEAEQKKAIEALQGKEVGGRQIAVKIAVDSQMQDEEKEAGEAGEAAAPAASSDAPVVVAA